jgi:hypothetical protein
MLAVRIVNAGEVVHHPPTICDGCGAAASELVILCFDHLAMCENCLYTLVNHVGPIYVKLRELPETSPLLTLERSPGGPC